MVTLQKIGNYMNRAVLEITGLSSENKPIGTIDGIVITNGSTYEEIDSGIIFKYNEANKEWIEQPASGTAGGNISLDYSALTNKPQIAGKELTGNKTLDELGIQPKGTYLTKETDPAVPAWAKESKKPTYTADEVGALSKNTTSLPNPKKIKFTGAVTEEYDGSVEKTINIPEGVGTDVLNQYIKTVDADKKFALKSELPKQGAAVEDAGDADVKDKLNALLASLRTVGIIAQ